MRAASFQAEEERDWVYQEKRREDRIDKHFKKVQIVPQEKDIGHGEEKEEGIPEKMSVLPAENKEWRHSGAVSQQGKQLKEDNETEMAVMKKAESQLKESETNDIISEKTGPEENEIPCNKNSSGSGLSNENRSINASRTGSTTTIVATTNNYSFFGIDSDNTSNHGSAENVSTAVIPIIKLCPDSDKSSCSATNRPIKQERGSNSAGHGIMYTAASTESITPYNVRATSSTSRSGSVWYSRVHESLLGNRPVTLVGTHSATRNFEIDPPGFLDVRKLGKSTLESDKLNTLLLSEQIKSVNKSVDTKSDSTLGRSGDSVKSKGPQGDDILHSLHTRRFKSDQSAHPAEFRDPIYEDRLLGESDFDSRIMEGEALALSQLTGIVKKVQEFPGAVTRLHSDHSGSVSSEQTHQDRYSHSAVVTGTTTIGSESSQMSEREWSEVVPGWGPQSLLWNSQKKWKRQEVIDDFY